MADKKGGLGRGIGALIPTANQTEDPIDVFFGAGGRKPAVGSTGQNQSKQDAPAPAIGLPGARARAGSRSAATAVVGSAASGSAAKSPDLAANDSELLPVPGAVFAQIELEQIVPNRLNPRTVFDPEALAELVHSVREFGVLQPVVVRPIREAQPDQPHFELIMGERRFRAAKEAGLGKIPAIVRDTADESMLRDALLENIHRANLNPLEEASAYQQLLQDFGITQDQLAERIGRSRPQITNTIRLLRLPLDVQQKVASGVLSAGHARCLLSLVDEDRMRYFANRVINEGLSVRSLEELVALDDPVKAKKKATIKPGSRMDALDEIAQRFGDQLDTRVKIVLGPKKGQINIDFANMADLQRILREINYRV